MITATRFWSMYEDMTFLSMILSSHMSGNSSRVICEKLLIMLSSLPNHSPYPRDGPNFMPINVESFTLACAFVGSVANTTFFLGNAW